MKVIDNLDKIDLSNDLSVKCYVCTIVKNTAIDWLRKNNKYKFDSYDDCEYEIESGDTSPVDLVISKEGYRNLVNCIHSLNDTYRSVCNLKFVCGFKESEIAKMLNISPKNVSVRIVRGRKKIIEMLKESKLV